jgi:hypothetical protein
VTTVESNAKSMTRALPFTVARCANAWTEGYGHEVRRVTAPLAAAVEGTSVSIAMRDRTAVPTATALLPISDVVVFSGFAGSRTWSPPV